MYILPWRVPSLRDMPFNFVSEKPSITEKQQPSLFILRMFYAVCFAVDVHGPLDAQALLEAEASRMSRHSPSTGHYCFGPKFYLFLAELRFYTAFGSQCLNPWSPVWEAWCSAMKSRCSRHGAFNGSCLTVTKSIWRGDGLDLRYSAGGK
jgi:hypothetical protein